MARTVGDAIDAARREAKNDRSQVRHVDEQLFIRRRNLVSRSSEINLMRYMQIKEEFLAAGR